MIDDDKPDEVRLILFFLQSGKRIYFSIFDHGCTGTDVEINEKVGLSGLFVWLNPCLKSQMSQEI